MSDRPIRRPSFVEMFTPKLVTVLREGYGLHDLQTDAIAGLTVAIVALPLSMAIAIACGLSPDRGLYTAIIGGFIVSALGGSRFQIGGPAGAFIVLIYSIVQRQGYDGLVLATMMAGAIMLVVGFMRWGTYIKYIPYPVTVRPASRRSYSPAKLKNSLASMLPRNRRSSCRSSKLLGRRSERYTQQRSSCLFWQSLSFSV